MKYYLKNRLLLISLTLLFSCGNAYKITTIDTVNVSDYNIYVFRLCEKIRVEGSARFLSCDIECDATDILAINDTQIREELYLLVEKTGNKVIYLTTKTDRSFDLEPDIFNTKAHKNYVFANDLENVYFGLQKQNTIFFTNKNETLTFEMTETINNSCAYTISTLHSKTKDDSPINNKLVRLSEVYSIPIRFMASKRILALQPTKEITLDTVETINLNGKRIIIKGKRNSIDGSQRRRLKYHPEFN